MDIFVVSLKNALERRKHINKQFMTQQIEFQYFDAIEPHQIEEALKNTGIELKNCSLTKGEIGCLLSHISLWKKIIDNNLPYMAIFEDDIYLGENVKAFLTDASWIDKHSDLIKLEEFTPRVVLGEKVKEFETEPYRALFDLKSKNLGTAGYILSLHGAKQLISYIQSLDKLIALDHLMFENCIQNKVLSVRQMKPALCIQDVTLYSTKDSVKFASHLYKERLTRRKYSKKSGVDKIVLELSRVFNQIKELLFFRVVGFK